MIAKQSRSAARAMTVRAPEGTDWRGSELAQTQEHDMANNLKSIAHSANAIFARSPGFVGCVVRSHDPPVLEFSLATDTDAEQFMKHLEAHSTGTRFRHQIDPRNPAVVLQYR